MSALGRNWRLRASNTQNQAITVTVTARAFKYTTTGLEWSSSELTLINAVSVAATSGTTVSSDQNNSTDKWEGLEITLAGTAASATNGTGALALTLERSTDNGTTWPTEGRGMNLGAALVLVAGDGTTQRRMNLLVR
jgi:hypothetical protein